MVLGRQKDRFVKKSSPGLHCLWKAIMGIVLLLCGLSCKEKKVTEPMKKEALEPIKLMTLDPGHFHAALVHKTMYPQVDSTIYLFAPKGPEAEDFLAKIRGYNTREASPTAWKNINYLGEDYLQKMIVGRPGNVMIVAGKNAKKIDYILEAVKSGLHVYADKPLVINSEGFEKLKTAFQIAQEKKVLIYDIMTERFESTTILQKLFSRQPSVFGKLVDGTPEEPAISKESVHHFFKYVSGQPLVRPPWFFDVDVEGEGLVDVTTHLVDLIQWEAFPEQILDSTDIVMHDAKRWPTVMDLEEFEEVTGLSTYPEYLQEDVQEGRLHVYCNGEMRYRLKGKWAKVSVTWNYRAPEGTGDTHYSIMRGTECDLIIKQGAQENYVPTLYVRPKRKEGFPARLEHVLEKQIKSRFPGTFSEEMEDGSFRIAIPDEYRIGHEAHFGQVTRNYLDYLAVGKLPNWEVPHMISKYYTTVTALQMARQK